MDNNSVDSSSGVEPRSSSGPLEITPQSFSSTRSSSSSSQSRSLSPGETMELFENVAAGGDHFEEEELEDVNFKEQSVIRRRSSSADSADPIPIEIPGVLVTAGN